jgi:putative transposase
MSQISLVQLAGSVRKFNLNRPFICPILRTQQSHDAIRARERGMRKFKSVGQAQRFVSAHAAMQNLFNLSRHLLVRAQHYRDLRISAFTEWERAVA